MREFFNSLPSKFIEKQLILTIGLSVVVYLLLLQAQ